jgi:antitoxin component of RelBE/YafQ-DinJ toxin-antitoxin module
MNTNPTEDCIGVPARIDDSVLRQNVSTLRRVIWAMTMILAVSLAVNLFLAYRIRNGRQPIVTPKPAPLLTGTAVSPIKARDLNGHEATISFQDSSQPLVIYVFTPQCPWCLRNLANLKTIFEQKHGSYHIITLSLTDKNLAKYVAEKHIDMPVFTSPTEDAKEQYRLGSTPQTIVVSPDGKVLRNWVGAYIGDRQAEVEQFFGVGLPGLTTEN